MATILWVFTILGALAGGLTLLESFTADSAPKQGAGAAMAVALVVIPYCLARAVRELSGSDELRKIAEQLNVLNGKTADHTRLLAAVANAASLVVVDKEESEACADVSTTQ